MRGEKPFGIFNRRVAISFGYFQDCQLLLGFALLFHCTFFLFKKVAMVWHPVHRLHSPYKYVYFEAFLTKFNIIYFGKLFLGTWWSNSRKLLLLLLSLKSYIIFHRIPPFVCISQFLFWGVLFCSSGS